MKRKPRQPGDPEIVKTSISMSQVLFDWADRYWRSEGFNSLSAYLAHLIYTEKKAEEGTAKPARYPQHRAEHSMAAEAGVSSAQATPEQQAANDQNLLALLKSRKTPPPK